nr:MAG TPA: hypothetical protein [Caudoviricetes sp.]
MTNNHLQSRYRLALAFFSAFLLLFRNKKKPIKTKTRALGAPLPPPRILDA